MKTFKLPQHFNRSALPSPEAYYMSIAQLTLIGSGEWRNAICPFHDDTNPSLRINVAIGCFRCMACDAKGGDVIAFHMKKHNMTFINAAKALNAWESHGSNQ
ncbi:MAG: hypothetical protein KGO49_06920 [Gammaproteobacteria bacterium]|nr:hypothetical protein [Gammaproteobacteria bacterium]